MDAIVHTVSRATLLKALERLNQTPWRDHPLRERLVSKRRAFGVNLYLLSWESGHNYRYVAEWSVGSRTPTTKQLQDYSDTIDKLAAEGFNNRYRSTGARA